MRHLYVTILAVKIMQKSTPLTVLSPTLVFISFIFVFNILTATQYFIQILSITMTIRKVKQVFTLLHFNFGNLFSFVDYVNYVFSIILLAFLSELQEFFLFTY